MITTAGNYASLAHTCFWICSAVNTSSRASATRNVFGLRQSFFHTSSQVMYSSSLASITSNADNVAGPIAAAPRCCFRPRFRRPIAAPQLAPSFPPTAPTFAAGESFRSAMRCGWSRSRDDKSSSRLIPPSSCSSRESNTLLNSRSFFLVW